MRPSTSPQRDKRGWGLAGLIYLLKALDHGALKDGSEVREAIVVLVDLMRRGNTNR